MRRSCLRCRLVDTGLLAAGKEAGEITDGHGDGDAGRCKCEGNEEIPAEHARDECTSTTGFEECHGGIHSAVSQGVVGSSEQEDSHVHGGEDADEDHVSADTSEEVDEEKDTPEHQVDSYSTVELHCRRSLLESTCNSLAGGVEVSEGKEERSKGGKDGEREGVAEEELEQSGYPHAKTTNEEESTSQNDRGRRIRRAEAHEHGGHWGKTEEEGGKTQGSRICVTLGSVTYGLVTTRLQIELFELLRRQLNGHGTGAAAKLCLGLAESGIAN